MVDLYQKSIHVSSFLSDGKLSAAIGHALAVEKFMAPRGLDKFKRAMSASRRRLPRGSILTEPSAMSASRRRLPRGSILTEPSRAEKSICPERSAAAKSAALGAPSGRPHTRSVLGNLVASTQTTTCSREEPNATMAAQEVPKANSAAVNFSKGASQASASQLLRPTHPRASGNQELERYHRLGTFFDSVSPHLTAIIKCPNDLIRASDVFIWATLSGYHSLADALWAVCEEPFDPLLMACLGAHCCRRAASRIVMRRTRELMVEQAEKLELRMSGVIDQVPTSQAAHRILAQHVKGLGSISLLELALMFEMKSFLAHRHAQSLMQLIWRGGSTVALRRFTIPDDYPYARLALHVLLPLNPPTDLRKQSHFFSTFEYTHLSTDFFLRAVLRTYNFRKREVERATEEEMQMRRSAGLLDDPRKRSQMRLSQTNKRLHDQFMHHEFLNILSSNARSKKEQAAIEQQSLVSFYQIPMVSFILRGWTHVLTMALCGLQLRRTLSPVSLDALAPELPAFNVVDAVQVVHTAAIVVDRLYKRFDQSVTRYYALLDIVLRLSNWIYLGGVIVRIAAIFVVESDYDTGRMLYHAFGFILSVYSTLMCLGVLKLLGRVSRPFGVLLIAIDQMLQEVSMYVAFSIVLCFAVAVGTFGLERIGDYGVEPPPDGPEEYTANRHKWYMLPMYAYIAPPFSGIPEDDFHGAAGLFMLVYLFFTTKVGGQWGSRTAHAPCHG